MSGNSPRDEAGLGTQKAVSGRTELIGLRKEYGDTVAVNGVNLEVEPGELLVLLGPSGCGKTTTLRMIAGLETPTDGTILIDGEEVTRTLPKNRGLSMVFQSYALYPHKTVRENLAFPIQKMDLSESERTQRVEVAAELLEIQELLDKQPGQLSGGQRQRVAVGRTIVREPRIFLMDEPLSNLDAKLRVQTRSEIRDLQQQLGTTTVYVTHDQEEAMSIADRIAIMRDGVIEQIGTPREVYNDPVNEFIAGFIGDPQINFLELDGGFEPFDTVDAPPNAVRAGLRPESIALDSAIDANDRCSFIAELDLIEPVGHSYELRMNTDDSILTAMIERLPADATAGDSLQFAFEENDLYWFADDGTAITQE